MRTTTITITPDGAAGARVGLATGLLAPRLVRRDGRTADVALVATTATLLGGDHARVDIHVGTGCHLMITDVASTVAYDAAGRMSFWDSTIRVDDGGVLTWFAEPLIVADGSNVRRSLHADVAPGARLVLREAVQLGRHGEQGGVLTTRTRIASGGRAAVVEDLVLDPRTRRRPGLIGDHRFVDTVTAVGFQPAQTSSVPTYRLASPGGQARQLTAHAHTSGVPALARCWAREALHTRP